MIFTCNIVGSMNLNNILIAFLYHPLNFELTANTHRGIFIYASSVLTVVPIVMPNTYLEKGKQELFLFQLINHLLIPKTNSFWNQDSKLGKTLL